MPNVGCLDLWINEVLLATKHGIMNHFGSRAVVNGYVMKIATSKRVVYDKNPLSEVVCQVRFERIADFSQEALDTLRGGFSEAGYMNFGQEQSFGFSQHFDANGQTFQPPVVIPQVRVQHGSSEDGFWRASYCPEFIALTCLKYSGWDEFLAKTLIAIECFMKAGVEVKVTRLGLRYKDVIEREAIGLEGVPWNDLIQPFLLGPLAIGALSDGQVASDGEIGEFVSQSHLRIDDGSLLLQSSLMSSLDGHRKAFLIDADFFKEDGMEPQLLSEQQILISSLEKLHANAGALFRRGITERLHHALGPGE